MPLLILLLLRDLPLPLFDGFFISLLGRDTLRPHHLFPVYIQAEGREEGREGGREGGRSGVSVFLDFSFFLMNNGRFLFILSGGGETGTESETQINQINKTDK